MNAISKAQKHFLTIKQEQRTCRICGKLLLNRKEKALHGRAIHGPKKPVKKSR